MTLPASAVVAAPVNLTLELKPTAPVRGVVTVAAGERREFTGWLEMHAAVEALWQDAHERSTGLTLTADDLPPADPTSP